MALGTKDKRVGRELPVGQGSSWTNGRQLGARAVTALLAAAILCGPLALVVATGNANRPLTAAASTGSVALTTDQQAAGAFAVGYVSSWLRATRDEPGDLPAYIDVTAVRGLTDTPWEFRDETLVSVAPVAGSQDMVSVVVAANVKQLAVTAEGDSTAEAWPRRYFQVAVMETAGSLRTIGLPAPIAGPAEAPTAQLVYSVDVNGSDPAFDAVFAFLGAYLAESGDVSRYTTPGSAIVAIAPAPYVQVELTDVIGDSAPASAPADGDTLRVLATATLTNALGQQVTATYALTLTARADRWEVTSIDPAPQEAISTETVNTSTAQPNGNATTKGK